MERINVRRKTIAPSVWVMQCIQIAVTAEALQTKLLKIIEVLRGGLPRQLDRSGTLLTDGKPPASIVVVLAISSSSPSRNSDLDTCQVRVNESLAVRGK